MRGRWLSRRVPKRWHRLFYAIHAWIVEDWIVREGGLQRSRASRKLRVIRFVLDWLEDGQTGDERDAHEAEMNYIRTLGRKFSSRVEAARKADPSPKRAKHRKNNRSNNPTNS